MLFRDTAKLKEYAQISGTPNFNGFKASLRAVEENYLVPILGRELYRVLNQEIDEATDDQPMDEIFINLLDHCRMALGPLFCYHHADKADVHFSDSGMQRSESSAMKNAYQEQRGKFTERNREEGENALELLLQFLEENRSDYPEWVDSQNFKEYRKLFIKSGADFQQAFRSPTPHRNYWALRSNMIDVEENNIKPLLGDELFNALKTEGLKENPDYTDEEIELLQKLKKAIANLTVAFAAPFLNVRIGSNGLTVPATASFSQNDSENTRAGISDDMLSTFITAATNAGTQWITNVKKYLTDNETLFPTWIGFVKAADNDDCLNSPDNEAVFGM